MLNSHFCRMLTRSNKSTAQTQCNESFVSKLVESNSTLTDMPENTSIVDVECIPDNANIVDVECLPDNANIVDVECLPDNANIVDVECLPDNVNIVDVECLPDNANIVDVECLRDNANIKDVECRPDNTSKIDVECIPDNANVVDVECMPDNANIIDVECIPDNINKIDVECRPDNTSKIDVECLPENTSIAEKKYIHCALTFPSRKTKLRKDNENKGMTITYLGPRNINTNCNSEQSKNNGKTEYVLQSPSNCYSIMTRSRTTVSQLTTKPKSQLATKPNRKVMRTLEQYLATSTLDVIPGDHSSYEPYKIEELAKAHAVLKWEKIYGSLYTYLKVDHFTNVDETVIPNIWDVGDVQSLERSFPMPYIQTSFNINLSYRNNEQLIANTCNISMIKQEVIAESNGHRCNSIAGGSPPLDDFACACTFQISHDGTTPITDYNPSCSSKMHHNPTTPNKESLHQINECSGELPPFDQHIDSNTNSSTLHMNEKNQCFKHCREDSNNLHIWEGLKNETLSSVAQETMHQNNFWKNLALMYEEISTVLRCLKSAKKMFLKRQNMVAADQIMRNVSLEILNFDQRIMEFKKEKPARVRRTILHAYWKECGGKGAYKTFKVTRVHLNRLKKAYRQTLLISCGTPSSDVCSSNSITNNHGSSDCQLPSARGSSVTRRKKKIDTVTKCLREASFHSSERPRTNCQLPSASGSSVTRRKKKTGRVTKCLREASFHVMSESETLYWARLKKLNKEIRKTTIIFKGCVSRIKSTKTTDKFVLDFADVTYIDGLRKKVSQFHNKIAAERKEGADFGYILTRPNIQSKNRRKYVRDLRQVEATLQTFKRRFSKSIKELGV